MKITQELPRDQVAIIFKALKLYESVLELSPEFSIKGEKDYLKFDIVTLRGMMTGKVVCEFTEEQFDTFTQNNGVDFPEYTISL